jgi:non-ribosomal peptide synthetase-like protein
MSASIGALRLDPGGRPADVAATGTSSDAPAVVASAGPMSVGDIEAALAESLAGVLRVERVAVDSDFFDELGADSMTMAHFCARIRKRGDLPGVSIKEVYRHPTIRSLATALAGSASVATAPPAGPVPAATPRSVADAAPATTHRPTTLAYVLCAAAQAAAAFGYLGAVAVAGALGIGWIAAAPGLLEVYLRAVVVVAAGLLALTLIPIAAKWILIGRWDETRIRVWSAGYVRFWIVRVLVQRSPMALFIGSPLYVIYLRALGARIGRGVVILSTRVPVGTDLLTIGDGTVIRKDAMFPVYRARDGYIETGPITLGRDVVVGEAAVLDIGVSMGDGAQLGHASSLHEGQSVPAGERRAGFAAQLPSDADLQAVASSPGADRRRILFPLAQVASFVLVTGPAAIAIAGLLALTVAPLAAAFAHGPGALADPTFYLDVAIASLVLFLGSLLVSLLVAMTVPRLLSRAIEPDRAYPLYGVRYAIHRAITRMTNLPFLVHLFGDSSFVVHYLRGLGYTFPDLVQTGTNFGLEVKHETPFHATVGSGTMVADGLSIINADYSSTSFRVSRTDIAPDSFLGNYVIYPSQATVGDDLLLATKVLVPVDGERREGIGLLGSPAFEIPRSVLRDRNFDHLREGEEHRRRLAAKDRHNAVTIGLYLLAQWLFVLGVVAITAAAANLYPTAGPLVFAVVPALAITWSVAYFVVVERASIAFGRLRPRTVSIYDPYFWSHERYWKLATQQLLLDGTPFKSLVWRALGVRIGRRVFDDGCRIVEKTLVTIGDDSTLGAASVLQSHSQEEGAFKSDHITLGARCTVGMYAVVHYGVRMGDDSGLAPDSFLMKGEEVPVGARWGGNPARDVRSADLGLSPELAAVCR